MELVDLSSDKKKKMVEMTLSVYNHMAKMESFEAMTGIVSLLNVIATIAMQAEKQGCFTDEEKKKFRLLVGKMLVDEGLATVCGNHLSDKVPTVACSGTKSGEGAS